MTILVGNVNPSQLECKKGKQNLPVFLATVCSIFSFKKCVPCLIYLFDLCKLVLLHKPLPLTLIFGPSSCKFGLY